MDVSSIALMKAVHRHPGLDVLARSDNGPDHVILAVARQSCSIDREFTHFLTFLFMSLIEKKKKAANLCQHVNTI